LRADLIEALVDAGYTRNTASRTIHPQDGYQRDNLDYRGKNKGLEIKWKGLGLAIP
jgi:hypothetical protein